ncbi:orotidine 5'-monophosphate decarboxylase [Salpingoeca rosetta]|uniref:Uridine 5'-monophosphate synthase n=1 Tax=Salpingoeca rosetta (strain ATCC 50818 / BSB-021) TaxID=946362 RepID=F2U4W7_SALR5|nr:orotidine 5'-monophosphate decarboxylase [Salpingoeca rosetta]EGD82683.1 orotidine 5'-monophosphate decarboxylase [Salpingoeca rosetta]|eukprot:XP_004995919.1 orotidine 5'-monophosphate decarboxylase [Salpingoeca rosetta]
MDEEARKALVLRLFDIGAVKFGTFTLKSGIESPVYVDLRVLVSHPDVLDQVANALLSAVSSVEYDTLCGVPYTALPFATLMSSKTGKPMLMRRKEVKAYGTKKMIEGVITPGQRCLIVEDLVTSGLSVFETVEPLEREQLIVNDVVVLLDRGQGGRKNIETRGKNLRSVLTLAQVLDVLVAAGKVDTVTADRVTAFIRDNQVTVTDKLEAQVLPTKKAKLQRTPFEDRAKLCKNAVGVALFSLMARKKTNLCVAADVVEAKALLDLADAVGPQICVLKTHCDIVRDWTDETGTQLRFLADKHDFLIFEDRKFADIGNTVVQQCSGGVHRIASWAHFTNAHALPGDGIVDGLRTAAGVENHGLLLLAQMSSAGNLLNKEYTSACVEMAKRHTDFVFGFISQERVIEGSEGDAFVYMTPGVKLSQEGDGLGQQYNTPTAVIADRNSDIIIVGRGIYKSDNPAATAAIYRKQAWDALA